MTFYGVYNVPALHAKLEIQFSDVSEGQYLANSASGTYTTISYMKLTSVLQLTNIMHHIK